MNYLSTSYDPGVVLASVLIATFASYVTLDLVRRVRTDARRAARNWWVGGSLAMGTGIWSMHFVGMLAFSLPIAIGYTKLLTFASWVAAVVVSGIALKIASGGSLTASRLVGGATTMGAGICAMHYIGMAALDMSPGIVWDTRLVGASAAIAVVASAAALLIFFWLRKLGDANRLPYQALAALVMGLAISGMHYTGMSAASFAEGSVCLSADSLSGNSLGMVVTLAAVSLLSLALSSSSALEKRLRSQEDQFASTLRMANEKLQLANDELQKQAFQDPLTGLPNRQLFDDRLMQALARIDRDHSRVTERHRGTLAVMFVDLDSFKPVNDRFGHAAGDEVLKAAASRLRGASRECDTVARLGGDEFVLLMEEVAGLADCARLAQRLVHELARPYDVAGRQIKVSASVGVVVYPLQGPREKLVVLADIAMYAAKRAGGNSYAVFDAQMNAGAMDDGSLQNDLRRAIEFDQLELHYQPKVRGSSGQISGVEALLRWKHPQRGEVSPGEFIPVAERFGLVNALGNWVIDEACRQMQAWAEVGLRMRVAINLSAHQLREDDLVARIENALRRHQVEASQLLCEITESVAREDIAASQRTFEQLARIGVFLSIDDFGTGYSSLSYLRQLPARQLKIDRSFVNDLASNSDARAIVDAVVRLAHALGLMVVAEGVESDVQRDILLQLGCDELQGYFFSRPMPAAALLAWARGQSPPGSADFSPSTMQSFAG